MTNSCKRMQLIIAFVVIMYGAFHQSVLAKSPLPRIIPGYDRIFSTEWRKLSMIKTHNQPSPIDTSYHYIEPSKAKHLKFIPSHRSKRICGFSKRAIRPMDIKRFDENYFADSLEEVEEKENLANRLELESARLKRDEEETTETSPLCPTNRTWTDLGPNHYPRFILNITCTERTCVNGSYRCAPRKFEVNVLQKLNQTEINVCDDTSLPVSLRPLWKFTPIKATLCCDCTTMY